MYGAAAIDRDDDFVAPFHDVGREHLQQQPRREQRDGQVVVQLAQQLTQQPQVLVHERLAARQHHPLHVQVAEGIHLVLDVFAAQLALFGVGLPDVAHHAPTIATAVRHEHELRQAVDSVRRPRGLTSQRFGWRDTRRHGQLPTITGKRAGSRRARRPPIARPSAERQSSAG